MISNCILKEGEKLFYKEKKIENFPRKLSTLNSYIDIYIQLNLS